MTAIRYDASHNMHGDDVTAVAAVRLSLNYSVWSGGSGGGDPVTAMTLNVTRCPNATLHDCAAAAAAATTTTEHVMHDDLSLSSDMMTIISVALYALICVTGLVGNALVIFVVLRYSKMKTPTNMYILNLAVADLCFLIGLPFLIVTSLVRTWVFGYWMCKLFYVCTSINWYTSVFMMTAMSADRFFAVCRPIQSIQYRTTNTALLVCLAVWLLSILIMIPMILYAKTVVTHGGGESCLLEWPDGLIPRDQAFIWYAFILGFFAPTVCIVCFYILVLHKLHSMGPLKKSRERKKSNKKVTRLVLTVITVYVICWLPYWLFQLILNHVTLQSDWIRPLFQAITVLSYANSMMNPLLYAFLSDNFRVSFVKAFKCVAAVDVNSHLHADASMATNGKRTRSRCCVTSVTVADNKSKSHAALLQAPDNDVTMMTQAIELSPLNVAEKADTNTEKAADVVNECVAVPSKKFVKTENGVHVAVSPGTLQSEISEDNNALVEEVE